MTAYTPGGATAPQPVPATIRLTVQGSIWTNSMIPPKATLNNHETPISYGTQDIPVWPGPTRLHMSCQWLRTYGQADLDLNLAPGQLVQVYYAPPFHQFSSGSIGFTKQRHKGVGFLIGLLVFVFVIIALSVTAVIIANTL